jgi:N-acetyl-anhydromuramyl-L-alanine amidase AmpD
VRGWHAGVSEWGGRSDVNSFSIGIENQGLGDEWPEAQIQANINVINALHKAYSITATVGHCDVAPGRKVDPGLNYPWDRVADAIEKEMKEE